MNELAEHCNKVTGYAEIAAESIITQFLAGIANELSAGYEVNLGENFGSFSVRWRTDRLAENSPRAPENSRYKVIFLEKNGLKQRLKV